MLTLTADLADIPRQYARLWSSRVYHGLRIPSAERPVVLLIPGFLAPAVSMAVMFEWLRRMGFRPVFADIFSNIACPERTYEAMAAALRKNFKDHPRPAYVIGHSLGGTIALGLTISHPELVAHGFAIGAPLAEVNGEIRVNETVRRLYQAVKPIRALRGGGQPGCSELECLCSFRRTVANGTIDPTRFTSIYSLQDPVVAWQGSVKKNADNQRILRGGHTSLIFNPDVYRLLYNSLTAVEDAA